QQIFQNQNFGFGCYSVGGTVGINKNLNSLIKISIFPNPTTSTFTISKNTNEALQFHLYNLIGKQVLNTTLKENTTTLERNNLAAGTYLFSITNASGKIIENGKLIFGE
ncbi:MAG: Secretion system C-terminal sorting domain, partial [Bacteroidota bacterium]